jgi:hypothetical protein
VALLEERNLFGQRRRSELVAEMAVVDPALEPIHCVFGCTRKKGVHHCGKQNLIE